MLSLARKSFHCATLRSPPPLASASGMSCSLASVAGFLEKSLEPFVDLFFFFFSVRSETSGGAVGRAGDGDGE